MTGSSGWTEFLGAFVKAVNTTEAFVCIKYDGHPGWSVVASAGAPRDTGLDPAKMPVGIVVPSQDGCCGGSVLLEQDAARAVAMSTFRPLESGSLTAAERDLWQSLVPHLQRAVKLQGERERLRMERDAVMLGFDQAGTALALVNQRGAVLSANAEARALFAGGSGLKLDEDGRLQAGDGLDGARLTEALRRASAGPQRMLLRRGGGRIPLLVIASQSGSAGEPVVLLNILDMERPPEIEPSTLQSLFGLTPSEVNVARRLAGGETLAEAALATGISVNTIRTQLKWVMHKTGTTRQAELVRLLLRLGRA